MTSESSSNMPSSCPEGGHLDRPPENSQHGSVPSDIFSQIRNAVQTGQLHQPEQLQGQAVMRSATPYLHRVAGPMETSHLSGILSEAVPNTHDAPVPTGPQMGPASTDTGVVGVSAAGPQSQEPSASRAPHGTAMAPNLSPGPSQRSLPSAPATQAPARYPVSKDPLMRAPDFDYQLANPSEPIINCTAVEIIVFLPRLFQNRMMAARFCNNGMKPPIHREILRAHRVFDEANGEDFRRNNIFNRYRSAMRGPGEEAGRHRFESWQARFRDAQKKGEKFDEPMPENKLEWYWERNKHVAPPGWNNEDMSVNNYLPDRLWLPGRRSTYIPTPVPFKALTTDVAIFPRGYDAADLTRAVTYAINNPPAGHGSVEWMFPTDWQKILGIIGRTQITPDHVDDKCIKRWERLYEARTGVVLPTPAPRAAAAVPHPVVSYTSAPHPTIRQTVARPAVQADTKRHQLQLAIPKSSGPPPVSLIRDEDLPPYALTDIAQIINFAKNNSKTDWTWCEEHVQTITRLLKKHWMKQLNLLLDMSEQPRWIYLQDLSTFHAISSFMDSGMQREIHWRIDMDHARVLEHVNTASPDMNLEQLADVVMHFREYSDSSLGLLSDGGQFVIETQDALNTDVELRYDLTDEEWADILRPVQRFNETQ